MINKTLDSLTESPYFLEVEVDRFWAYLGYKDVMGMMKEGVRFSEFIESMCDEPCIVHEGLGD